RAPLSPASSPPVLNPRHKSPRCLKEIVAIVFLLLDKVNTRTLQPWMPCWAVLALCQESGVSSRTRHPGGVDGRDVGGAISSDDGAIHAYVPAQGPNASSGCS